MMLSSWKDTSPPFRKIFQGEACIWGYLYFIFVIPDFQTDQGHMSIQLFIKLSKENNCQRNDIAILSFNIFNVLQIFKPISQRTVKTFFPNLFVKWKLPPLFTDASIPILRQSRHPQVFQVWKLLATSRQIIIFCQQLTTMTSM